MPWASNSPNFRLWESAEKPVVTRSPNPAKPSRVFSWAPICRVISRQMGAQEKTLEGLAGLGDLVTTGFSADSHNRKFGELLAQGMEYNKAVAQIGGVVPEGVR